MRRYQSLAIAIFAAIIGPGVHSEALAEGGHKHGVPLHGGRVEMTKEYHFEVVFAKGGLMVYPRTHEDKPLDVTRLSGTATFFHPNSPNPWFVRKLAPASATPGRPASALGSAIDLSTVPPSGAKVELQVTGLPEIAETTAKFSVPFALAPTSEIVVTKATKADERAIAALKLCPVSNEDLGSMGGPLKISRGEKATFICCKGCLKKIQSDPDKYLGKVASAPTAKGEHDQHNH